MLSEEGSISLNKSGKQIQISVQLGEIARCSTNAINKLVKTKVCILMLKQINPKLQDYYSVSIVTW